MSIDNEGKIANVKASIENYIKANLSGLTIDYEGMPFESSGVSVWIQPRIIGFAGRDFHRQVTSGSTLGQTTQVLLNFNIFVSPEQMGRRTNRHYQVRDTIARYFHIGKQINLYDMADWNTALQAMEVNEIMTDRVIPDKDFYQYNFSVGILWLEKWK